MKKSVAATLVLVCLPLLGCDAPVPTGPVNSGPPAPQAIAKQDDASSAETADAWQEYSFPEAGFKVRFPCLPTLQTPEKPSQSYSALGAPATCTVRVESDSPEKLDEKLAALIQQQPRWQPEPVQKAVTLAGQAAVEVVSEAEPGKFKRQPPITVVRYLKTESAIYIVSIECRPEPTTEPMRKAYFDSFQLLK